MLMSAFRASTGLATGARQAIQIKPVGTFLLHLDRSRCLIAAGTEDAKQNCQREHHASGRIHDHSPAAKHLQQIAQSQLPFLVRGSRSFHFAGELLGIDPVASCARKSVLTVTGQLYPPKVAALERARRAVEVAVAMRCPPSPGRRTRPATNRLIPGR